VLRRIDADLDDTVAAKRPITVDDLLTFRLGFGNVTVPPGTYPIQLAEEHLQLATLGPPWPPSPFTPDEWIARLATLPLMDQPGEAWRYNTGSQVLGVLLERATGVPLEALLRERLLDPLGMHDTGFSFTPAQRGRMTTAYVPDPDTGAPVVLDRVDDSWWSRPPTRPDASGGLLSTIDDLWAFAQLFLDGGVHRGRLIVSEASLALMTTDHLTPAQRAAGSPILGAHDSWGLGLAVPASGGDRAHIPGGFGWIGGSGTSWRTDPERDLTGILLTQRGLASPEPPPLFDDFWRVAYAVLDV
jgi:CubicO group peptidase (beta-lactamase class C family)